MNIEWYGTARGKDSVESIVSHLDPVRDAVKNKAENMGREASAKLAGHHRKGKAHIVVTPAPPRKLDAWVELRDQDPGGKGLAGKNKMDRSAMSIEFGWTTKKGEEVPGLDILGSVMRRAVGRYKGGIKR